ncbi:MAG: DNA adenine methylase [Polyangiaceae bacterium]|nr:DNA adenine methylase [Polyangiaceae bacterium]
MAAPPFDPSSTRQRALGADETPSTRPDDDDAPGPKPFLKWAGGKWSLAAEIAKKMPADLKGRVYREPFLGGGAMFFWLSHRVGAKRYVLSDALDDLVTTYEVVRDQPEALIAELETLRDDHSEETFYSVRDKFNGRTKKPLKRAAWLIYLNKTCFNGLYRTNRAGVFNVPMGRYANTPNIANARRIRAASEALKDVDISCAPFEELRQKAEPGDVIYLDPPYVPLTRTANFDSYAGGAFGRAQQEQLADLYRELDKRGCLLVLSNSETPEVRELYRGFEIDVITAARNISSRGSTRGSVTEVLVRNTRSWPPSALR